MEKELQDQFQLILQGMADMEKRFDSKFEDIERRFDSKFEDIEKRFDSKFEDMQGQISDIKVEIRDSELRTRIFIENQVNKRLDSLFDGYKLTHEKQWEMERDTERLKEQMSEMQTRLALLEKKISA